MSGPRFLLWIGLIFVALRVVRYVMAARIFLTSALRHVRCAPCAEDSVPADIREILALPDTELGMHGFMPRGFIVHDSLLTYYGEPDYQRVYWHAGADVEAFAMRRVAPEYGASVNLQFVNRLEGGKQLITTDLGRPEHLPSMQVESLPGASMAQLYARHLERRAADPAVWLPGPLELGQIAANQADTFEALRRSYRQQGWSVATADPHLDRITLRGALQMVSRSIKAYGAKGASLSTPGEASERNRRLRVEVDCQCVRRVARTPAQAPGMPWPLLTLIAITAAGSVLGMSVLWSVHAALLVFVVLLVHEAGHAAVMRLVGHHAVHIFFVPFLGALTIGRPADAGVRQRLAVTMAGPVPGVLIGAALLGLYAHTHTRPWLEAGLMFLFINALNLMPVVPFDGGRYFETLTRPDGAARFALTVASSLLLAASAWWLRDPVLTALALLSCLVLPQQWRAFQFRRLLGRQIVDRADWHGIARTALVVMTQPRFALWRAPARQMAARTAADQFAAAQASRGDCVVGVLAYAAILLATRIGRPDLGGPAPLDGPVRRRQAVLFGRCSPPRGS